MGGGFQTKTNTDPVSMFALNPQTSHVTWKSLSREGSKCCLRIGTALCETTLPMQKHFFWPLKGETKSKSKSCLDRIRTRHNLLLYTCKLTVFTLWTSNVACVCFFFKHFNDKNCGQNPLAHSSIRCVYLSVCNGWHWVRHNFSSSHQLDKLQFKWLSPGHFDGNSLSGLIFKDKLI